MLRRTAGIALSALLALLLITLPGCGRSERAEDSRVIGDALTVYSSLPLTGPLAGVARDVVRAEKLALAEGGGEAAGYRISYVSLDSADPETGRWSPAIVADNARAAVEDLQTIAYLGELESGASAISVPILNGGGMLQISPGDTFAGLTSPLAPGEPEKYYPSGVRTFARTVPSDAQQALAVVALLKRRGAERVWVAHDRQVAGDALAGLIVRRLRAGGIEAVRREGLDTRRDVPGDIAERVQDERADAFVYTGGYTPYATDLVRAVHAGAPRVALFATDAMAVAPELGTRAGGAADRLLLTAVSPGRSAEVRDFARRFRERFGTEPDPRAIFGYDAMRVVLRAVETAGADAGSRPAVIRAALRTVGEPRGSFGAFRPSGDGLVRVGPAL